MEFLNEIIGLVNSGKFEDVIDRVDSFLDENPQYKTIDYYHFANPLEEILFDHYVGEIDSVRKLNLDEPLEEIYTIYAIAHMALARTDEAERYLKIANRINPVSATILMRMCRFYQENHQESNLGNLSMDIFRYAYDVETLTSNYFIYADYLFHTNQDMELYGHLLNFYVYLRSGEEDKPVSEDVRYFKENGFQLGANTEVLMMLMYLIDVHEKQNKANAAGYFRTIFNELAEFTKTLNNL